MISKTEGQTPEGQDQDNAEADGEKSVDGLGFFHDGLLSGRPLSRNMPKNISLKYLHLLTGKASVFVQKSNYFVVENEPELGFSSRPSDKSLRHPPRVQGL